MEPAKKRLQETLEWRRDYKPDLIKPEEIQEETEGGKIVVTGFTKAGLPVIYLRPARENVR
jgi:phenylacetate-coenzyme A ligase PaaK-like adenylate-forming protein